MSVLRALGLMSIETTKRNIIFYPFWNPDWSGTVESPDTMEKRGCLQADRDQ